MFLCTFTIFAVVGYFITQISKDISEFWFYSSALVTFMQLFFYFSTALINPGITTAKASLPEGETGIG